MISVILFILSLARFYDSQSMILLHIRVQDIIYFAEIYVIILTETFKTKLMEIIFTFY